MAFWRRKARKKSTPQGASLTPNIDTAVPWQPVTTWFALCEAWVPAGWNLRLFWTRRVDGPSRAGIGSLSSWRHVLPGVPGKDNDYRVYEVFTNHRHAAAEDAGLFDEAVALANRSPCSPQTLTRAARDFAGKNPSFAVEAGSRTSERSFVVAAEGQAHARDVPLNSKEADGEIFGTAGRGRVHFRIHPGVGNRGRRGLEKGASILF